jgi:hypothetical protein
MSLDTEVCTTMIDERHFGEGSHVFQAEYYSVLPQAAIHRFGLRRSEPRILSAWSSRLKRYSSSYQTLGEPGISDLAASRLCDDAKAGQIFIAPRVAIAVEDETSIER